MSQALWEGAGEEEARIEWEGLWVPAQFPYLNTLFQGRPRHYMDEFSFRHPQMERGKRAKSFLAFDALDGYGDSVNSKNILYTEKITLDESDRQELNRRLTILRRLTYNSRLARQNRVGVTAVYFVPCADENSFSFGGRGRYETLRGTARYVDLPGRRLRIDDVCVAFDDLLSLTAEDEAVFGNPWNE